MPHGHATRDKWTKGEFSPTYLTWRAMIQRCYHKNAKNFKYYGGRGVKICDRWLNSFESFLEDMGERPKNKTLGRINDSLIYSKDTCRWMSRSEQSSDRRPYKNPKRAGEKHPLSKITEKDVLEIKNMLRKGISGSIIANSFSISSSQISMIKNGKRWGHVK